MPDTQIDGPFWPIDDVWPPNTLTPGAIAAYKWLHTRGEIEVQRITTHPITGVVRIHYLTAEPDAEARRKLLRSALASAALAAGQAMQTRMGGEGK